MVITVQCPSCATSFPVDPQKIPEKGVKVRCSSCAGVFRVERPAEEAPPPPPPVPETPVVESPPMEAEPTPSEGEVAAQEPPPPAAPEPVVDEELHFRAGEPQEPQEERATTEPAPEEPAAHWTTEYPPAQPEPPSQVEPEPWGGSAPRAEVESWIAPTPEPEVAPEIAAETGPATEAAAPDVQDAVPGVEDAVPHAEGAAVEPEEEAGLGEQTVSGAAVDEWVVEREVEIDTSGLDIRPMDTIETSGEQARDEVPASEPPLDFETTILPMDAAEPVAEAPPAPSEAAAPAEPAPVVEPEPTREAAPLPPPEPPAAPQGIGAFTLGKRDPKDKARRLARVLVSDMIMYNPQRHERALANGTLKEDFEDEIRKSWKEYVEQVGEQLAREHNFWTDALNEVLAKGERVF